MWQSLNTFQVALTKNSKEDQTETKQQKVSEHKPLETKPLETKPLETKQQKVGEPKQLKTPKQIELQTEIKPTRRDIFIRRRPSLLMKPIPTEAKELKNKPIITKDIIKSAQTKESTESSKDERSNKFLSQLFRKRSRTVLN